MKRRIIITIGGRVQGIFFRRSAQRVAKSLGLVGCAKNLEDGKVELVAEGEEKKLKKLLDWSLHGSALARIDSLSFLWQEPGGKFQDFSIDREEKSFLEDKSSALRQFSRSFLPRSRSFQVLEHIPQHVVIIPDGNRRWAKERGLLPWEGHQKGFDQAMALAKEAKNMGIRYLTIWGFSTENWSRDALEVKKLMLIFEAMIQRLKKEADENQFSVHHLGRKDRLPKKLISDLLQLEEATKKYQEYHFAVALDYGGRDEILRAFQKIFHEKFALTEENVSKTLDTKDFPDPDLIIRTSGEQRLSGIMPWQSVYAELYFSQVHFPDFDPEKFRAAVVDFSSRHRRFGK